MKQLIMDGKLKAGSQILSMRALARELHISVITVQKAYETLQKDGFIETISGKGSFVSNHNINFIQEEHLRRIEGHIEKAVMIAAQNGIEREKLIKLVDFFYNND
jgi:GntR family transcriptional regulator